MASLIAAGLRRPDQAAAKVKKTATQKVAVFTFSRGRVLGAGRRADTQRVARSLPLRVFSWCHLFGRGDLAGLVQRLVQIRKARVRFVLAGWRTADIDVPIAVVEADSDAHAWPLRRMAGVSSTRRAILMSIPWRAR